MRERGLALGVRQTAVPVGGVVAALVLPQLGGPRAGFLAGALRIGVGHWSDTVRSRFGPFRLIGAAIAATLALVAAVAAAGGWILVPALVVATALSMAWNGVAFTVAAELGGRRSGAAIGFQQTALSAAGVVIPVAFAAAVAATSWRTSFGVAAVFPLAGWLLLRRSAE